MLYHYRPLHFFLSLAIAQKYSVQYLVCDVLKVLQLFRTGINRYLNRRPIMLFTSRCFPCTKCLNASDSFNPTDSGVYCVFLYISQTFIFEDRRQIAKKSTTGEVRTNGKILSLDLKSNALTTGPPWLLFDNAIMITIQRFNH